MAKKVTVLPDKNYDPRNNIQSEINKQQIQKRNIPQSTREKSGSGIWYWLVGLLLLGLMKALTSSIRHSTSKTNTPTYTYNNYR